AAWKYGLTLVINEFSLAPSPVWVALNDLFEGGRLRVDALGKTFPKHPNTRIVITDNCRALATNRDYVGRRRQDLTSAERFWHVEARWPSAQQEFDLLMQKTARLARFYGLQIEDFFESIVYAAVRFANVTRQAAANSNRAVRLPAISTRVLVRFMEITVAKFHENPLSHTILEDALKLALAAGLSPDKESMIIDWMHAEFATGFRQRSKKCAVKIEIQIERDDEEKDDV
ncbi:MAG: hypothetical protein Q4E62_04045, partial [Sutterellaceae bacterium]|nr:hypothetical protein [Sutterellaceae bacterium]